KIANYFNLSPFFSPRLSKNMSIRVVTAFSRMFQSIVKSLRIPMEMFHVTIHKHGNISSAFCAIALDTALRDKTIKERDVVCLPVFGGGLTWGSVLLRW
ncbi:MAG: hypothetical protein H8D67_09895, partial [Deltaproteobacteria bacterium]|nr:hypothetical protein [Deltaproteobacteria bacterium]